MEQDRLAIEGAPPQRNDRAFTASLSIPLPLFNTNRGRIAATQAERTQSQAEMLALGSRIATEVASAHVEAASLLDVLDDYAQNTQPASGRNVALAQKGYREGLASLTEAVQAQRLQGDLKLSYLQTLNRYLQALTRLRFAAGDVTLSSAGTKP